MPGIEDVEPLVLEEDDEPTAEQNPMECAAAGDEIEGEAG
jgi:hypothetical protein